MLPNTYKNEKKKGARKEEGALGGCRLTGLPSPFEKDAL
jgi:hypothetical protein